MTSSPTEAEQARIERRSVLKYLGVSGVSATTLLAGCSGGDSSNGDEATTAAQTANETTVTGTGNAATLTTGGHLRVGMKAGVKNLNPLEKAKIAGYIFGDWMYSKLIRVSPDLSLQPDLATDWESNEANDVWTFHLRDDATFSHNGKSVLAEDVKATFEVMESTDRATGASSSLDPVESINVVDDTTLEMQLEYPYGDYPWKMTKRFSNILPRDVIENEYDAISQNDYGSGPFVLQDYETNNYYTFEAYDDHHLTDDEDNPLPYVDKLTVRVEPDPVSRINSLTDQRTDVLNSVGASSYEKVKSEDGIEALNGPGGLFAPIVMPTTLEPFGDLKVRQAIKYAVDRKQMLQGAVSGRGSLGADHPVAPVNNFHVELDDKFGDTANVEKAKELLREAGYGDGLKLPTLTYSTGGGPQMEPMAALLQQQLKQVGIEFEIQNMSWDRFLSEVWNSEDNFYISRWGMRLIPGAFFKLTCTSDAEWNEMKWSNEEFDEAVENALQTADPEKKKQYYGKAERLLRNEGGWIIPFFNDRLGAGGDYVNDFELDPTGLRFPLRDVALSEDAPEGPN
jgi:peptide/nickel transport system substrate-binding protein